MILSSSQAANGKPLASIITIFLNEERFLQEAVESVLTQTRSDWELLLVDDGSTDRSTGLARGYAERYPDKIRYLEHPDHQNRGMSASRNLGIGAVRGDYIAFLDADDVWLPEKLKQQAAILDAHPEVAAVCGRAQWWYSWTGERGDAGRDFLQRFGVPLNGVVPPPELVLNYLRDEWASLCDLMLRRDVVEAIGGYEATFRGMYEDQAFHAKLCLTYPIFVSEECWYRYRQHPDSCCAVADVTGQYRRARRTFLTWFEEYLAERGSPDPRVDALLRRELWPFRHPILAGVTGRARHHGYQLKKLLVGALHRVLPGDISQIRRPAQ